MPAYEVRVHDGRLAIQWSDEADGEWEARMGATRQGQGQGQGIRKERGYPRYVGKGSDHGDG